MFERLTGGGSRGRDLGHGSRTSHSRPEIVVRLLSLRWGLRLWGPLRGIPWVVLLLLLLLRWLGSRGFGRIGGDDRHLRLILG